MQLWLWESDVTRNNLTIDCYKVSGSRTGYIYLGIKDHIYLGERLDFDINYEPETTSYFGSLEDNHIHYD